MSRCYWGDEPARGTLEKPRTCSIVEVQRRLLVMLKISDARALIVATGAVVLAGFRVARKEKRLGFDEMIEVLRSARPVISCEPRAAGKVIGRLLRWIPPRGMGRCMKRSVILLHLWTSENLEVRIHLGAAADPEGKARGHAWLTVNDSELERYCGDSGGWVEICEI